MTFFLIKTNIPLVLWRRHACFSCMFWDIFPPPKNQSLSTVVRVEFSMCQKKKVLEIKLRDPTNLKYIVVVENLGSALSCCPKSFLREKVWLNYATKEIHLYIFRNFANSTTFSCWTFNRFLLQNRFKNFDKSSQK